MHWAMMPYRKLYGAIAGRSSRSEFWMFVLLNVGICVAIGAVFSILVGTAGLVDSPTAFIAGAGILMVLLMIPGYVWFTLTFFAGAAVTIRRLHDLNLSGWIYVLFLVLCFVPLLNMLVFLIMLVLMCVKGTNGPNNYGSDPTDPNPAEVFA